MALSNTVLQGLIKTEIQAVFGTPEDADKLDKFAEAIAKAVVTHITSAAVVTVQNITPGPASATGTIA